MANHYVRESATGTDSGDDWTNAYTDLPTVLTRGDVYYMADGSYTGHVFDDVESSTIVTSIKKAISTDHGTETGWDSSYGDGVTQFNGEFIFVTSYWTIDGQVGGGPLSWASGHGIKIQATAPNQRLVDFRGSNWWNPPIPGNIDLLHIEIEHLGRETEDADIGIYSTIDAAYRTEANKGIGPQNVNVRYCYLHDFGFVCIQTFFAGNWLIEYNFITRNTASVGGHSEALQDFGSDDMIIRNNFFQEIEGTGFLAMKKNWDLTNDNWEVYGNIFSYTITNRTTEEYYIGHGVLGHTDETDGACTNIKFYHNTTVNIAGWRSGIYLPNNSNVEVYNNLWYYCDNYTNLDEANLGILGAGINFDYNVYIDSPLNATTPATNDIIDTGDPFISWTDDNFKLTEQIVGYDLGTGGWSTDMYGNTRGNWTRGAIEYLVLADIYIAFTI